MSRHGVQYVLKNLCKLDKWKTQEELVGLKQLSILDEKNLNVMPLRNREKSSNDLTQDLRD